MTDIKDNNILIPISSENQLYVENVCTNGGYTFQTFFEHLINLYKNSLNQPLSIPHEQEEQPKKKKK
jgi:hypothetical protein